MRASPHTVYSNTFMTSLNSRVLSQQTKQKMSASNSVSLSSMSRPAVSSHLATVDRDAAPQPPLTIHITHEVNKDQVRALRCGHARCSRRG